MLNKTLGLNGVRHQVVSTLCRLILLTLMQVGRHKFCWNCLEECHRPIECDTVEKWVSMINEGESQNLYWTIGNSKPYPKCKRAIEKNFGCMRMTCLLPCGFQFCWICLRDWNVHGYDTSVACNQCRPPEAREASKPENSHESVSEDVMKMTAKMSIR